MAVTTQVDQGEWLVEHRWEMDRGESAWLEQLAVFDRDQRWADDGQLSCAEWLKWRTGMARSTVYEKLRIAHELSRRPLVAEAFADGRLSYSAVRLITRLDQVTADVDAALIAVAVSGSIGDVERMVSLYQLHAEQHRPPPDPEVRRGLRIQRYGDGTGRIEVILTDIEIEEFAAAIQAFLDLSASSGPVDESPVADSDAPIDEPSWPAKRADALIEMTRTAVAHAGDGYAMGADRYLVHVIRRGSQITLADGTPIVADRGEQVGCDHSQVEHVLGREGDPLALGRKTRQWNISQRRAILVRDSGHCRFPGCERRIVDIHHLQPWGEGGPTDITNGLLICARHHTLLHRSYRATGDANRQITFRRPGGTILGSTSPSNVTGWWQAQSTTGRPIPARGPAL